MCSSLEWLKTEWSVEILCFFWSIVFQQNYMFNVRSTVIKWVIFTKIFMSLIVFPQGPVRILWYSNHSLWKECHHPCRLFPLRLLRSLRLPFPRLPTLWLSSEWFSEITSVNSVKPASFARFADSLCGWFALCHVIIFASGGKADRHGDFRAVGRDVWVETNS